MWWIRQSILQALAEQSRIVRLPLNQVGSLNKINKAFARFEQENERTRFAGGACQRARPARRRRSPIRLCRVVTSRWMPPSDGEDNNLLDVLVNTDSPNADRGLINESLSTEVERALATLTDRERDIIRYFFGIGCPEMTPRRDWREVRADARTCASDKAEKRHPPFLRHSSRNKFLKSSLG